MTLLQGSSLNLKLIIMKQYLTDSKYLLCSQWSINESVTWNFEMMIPLLQASRMNCNVLENEVLGSCSIKLLSMFYIL